jgi:hypothetical protein
MKTVIQVLPRKDFKVYVYFDDGKIKLYDMAPLLGKGVFQKISNLDDFMEKCTVLNGTLAWDVGGNFDIYNCIDIDPESIYEDGQDVGDPLNKIVA